MATKEERQKVVEKIKNFSNDGSIFLDKKDLKIVLESLEQVNILQNEIENIIKDRLDELKSTLLEIKNEQKMETIRQQMLSCCSDPLIDIQNGNVNLFNKINQGMMRW